ncbi:DNA-processing protein DprA [Solihabitans fulvus]|uniref:DNA-processing protein DprA n=1 Tax=Solihabitans fulvus TaxID=1892852 RepID=UPI001CB76403|nr:DNA-processing protein DprA [Solihabitans fulvus]
MSAATPADPVRLARAYLVRVAEPPAAALVALVEQDGPVRAAELVRSGDAPAAVLRETSARAHLELAETDLRNGATIGARLVTPEDEEWPGWPLAGLCAAGQRGVRIGVEPLALWVRGVGRLDELTDRAVAVVGSRAASGYGEHVAAEFGHGLSEAGVTVVSGAAHGIDGAAHRGALMAAGSTIAVLACGVDIAYPAGHDRLLSLVADRGAVLSEYPPGTPPARHRFLARNRLIAALAAGTVVVEAGRRSGAKNTAATTCAIGRVLMVVPGPVTSASSLGCNELLRGGEAIAVSTVHDVIETAGRIGVDLAPSVGDADEPIAPPGSDTMRVHEALSRGAGRSAELIAVESGVPLPRVRALLPELEFAGLASRGESGWRRARNESGRGDA